MAVPKSNNHESQLFTDDDRSIPYIPPSDLCRLVADRIDTHPDVDGVFLVVKWKDNSSCWASTGEAYPSEWVDILEDAKSDYREEHSLTMREILGRR